jgi:hypothetical protein
MPRHKRLHGRIMRRSTVANRILERRYDSSRVVAEDRLRERCVVAPRPVAAPGGEQSGELGAGPLEQGHEIDRLSPGGGLVAPACRDHLAHDGGQHQSRVLKADQIEALERLVDEIERVAAVGKHGHWSASRFLSPYAR